jgi:rubrerythrin
MHDMTAANLRSAFGGESQAHMRYLIWGEKAEKDGFPNVGRLFAAVAWAEQVHATNHFKTMKAVAGGFLVASGAEFGLGTTSENLEGAIRGENFEVDEMYPAYIATAQFQEEKQAVRSCQWAWEAEKTHAALYSRAKSSVDAGADPELGPIQVCAVCGYTVEGDIPDKCPVCNVGQDQFRTFA